MENELRERLEKLHNKVSNKLECYGEAGYLKDTTCTLEMQEMADLDEFMDAFLYDQLQEVNDMSNRPSFEKLAAGMQDAYDKTMTRDHAVDVVAAQFPTADLDVLYAMWFGIDAYVNAH